MSISWVDNGILRFGGPLPPGHGGGGTSREGYRYDGSGVAPPGVGPVRSWILYPDGLGGVVRAVGPWMVLLNDWQHPELQGARMVVSPLFDSTRDTCSLEMWAQPGNYVAVQSWPVLLGPDARDLVTGVWPALMCDTVCSQIGASPPTGIAKCELYWLLKDRQTLTGSPGLVTTETPTASYVPRVSWSNLTPPTAACYVAVRFTWTVDPGASGIMTCHYREPALAFVGGQVQNIASNNFALRYI